MQTLQLKMNPPKYSVGDRVYCNVLINDQPLKKQPFIVDKVNPDGTYDLKGVYRRYLKNAPEDRLRHAIATPEALVKIWKLKDPYLLDIDKMEEWIERRIEAQNLYWLMTTCHPTDIGLEESRFDVMDKISKKGLQFLEDLGWPATLDSYYKRVDGGEVYTLEDILWHLNDDLDSWRTLMYEQEKKINELTDGDYYCLVDLSLGPGQANLEHKSLAGKGMECTSLKEMKWFFKYYPHVQEIWKECLRLHKAFYEQLNIGRTGTPRLLTDKYNHADSSTSNIASMCRAVGIDVETLEDTTDFPPRIIANHVWLIADHNYEPATQEEYLAYQKAHPDEEAPDE